MTTATATLLPTEAAPAPSPLQYPGVVFSAVGLTLPEGLPFSVWLLGLGRGLISGRRFAVTAFQALDDFPVHRTLVFFGVLLNRRVEVIGDANSQRAAGRVGLFGRHGYCWLHHTSIIPSCLFLVTCGIICNEA